MPQHVQNLLRKSSQNAASPEHIELHSSKDIQIQRGWMFTGIYRRRDFSKKGFLSLYHYESAGLYSSASKRLIFTKKKRFSNTLIKGKTTFSKLIPRNGKTILPGNAKKNNSDLDSQLGEFGRGPEEKSCHELQKFSQLLKIRRFNCEVVSEVSSKQFLLPRIS